MVRVLTNEMPSYETPILAPFRVIKCIIGFNPIPSSSTRVMSSTQTLNDLMMQMQNLETSVTTVLMEAVVKMAALTDTNFFMMVETREGRRFAGKR